MIDQKTLKQLIRLMVENDLTELDLEDQGEKVKLKRGPGEPGVQYVSAPPVAVANTGAAEPALPAAAPPEQEDLVAITSPMVGTFYAAPRPDAKPFVVVGDHVNPDQVVCIIEAMKVFNEIKAETTGTIQKVLVESGQAVEFGQPVFMVKAD